MYEEIGRNKRRTVVYIVVFALVWLAVGAGVGAVVGASGSAQGNGSQGDGARSATLSDIVTGIVVAAILISIAIAFSLLAGDRAVLRIAGAQQADRAVYPQLYDLVEALALGDGLPMPTVYVAQDASPNAFATGISPAKASVTVTTGLLALLDREELEGVLAHELSHIKNYDTRLLLVVSTLIGLAALLASVVWRSAFFMRTRGRNGQQLLIVVLAAGALLSVVAFLVGPLIRLALSRRRESLADASGVELSRNPAGLLGALRKLQADSTPMATVNHATSAMYIDDPLQNHASRYQRLFDTHPPIADRIAVLERMQLGLAV